MGQYIMTFSKNGYIKYTSHLDMVRLFQRCFKRAGQQLEYSKGFNPHPKMLFAQPLSLGYIGQEEWLEFELKDSKDPSKVVSALRPQMPQGIEILHCQFKKEGEKNLASRCCGATYKIIIPVNSILCKENGLDDVMRMEVDFLEKKEIFVEKKIKKSHERRKIDIRYMIKDLKIKVVDDILIMKADIAAGSKANLSPKLLLTAFLKYNSMTVSPEYIEISREKLEFQKL